VRPAIHVACAAGWPARHGLPAGGAQPAEGDGYQPGTHVALLSRVDRVRRAAAELLDQPRDVQGSDVGAQTAVAVSSGDDFLHACHAPLGGAAHLGGRLDLPGQRAERPGAQLDAGPDVATQAGPRVFRSEGIVRRFQRLFHRHDAEALQQFGLAAVAAVERAHADSGAFGDSRDGRACAQCAEDVTCRVQHGQVIAPGLGLPTVHGLRAQ
jgi:hypothetical protein